MTDTAPRAVTRAMLLNANREQAKEIDLLRAQLATLKTDNYDGPQMAEKILRQQAEIERLRVLVSAIKDIMLRWNSDANYTDQNAVYAIDALTDPEVGRTP